MIHTEHSINEYSASQKKLDSPKSVLYIITVVLLVFGWAAGIGLVLGLGWLGVL